MTDIHSGELLVLGDDSLALQTLDRLLYNRNVPMTRLERLESLDDIIADTNTCLALLNLREASITPSGLKSLKRFSSRGAKLLLTATDGSNQAEDHPINQIAREFGFAFNMDCVIRPNPARGLHPKEAVFQDFVANRGLSNVLALNNEDERGQKLDKIQASAQIKDDKTILYPYGCTLEVLNNEPNAIIMTSSQLTLPSGQAICVLYKSASFKILGVGSTQLFSDRYIEQEDNKSIVGALLDFLLDDRLELNRSDARTVEIKKPLIRYPPDTDYLIDIPIACIRSSEPVTSDISLLFNSTLFELNNSRLEPVLRAYKELAVPKERLTLPRPIIKAQPLELEPATHGFRLRPMG